MRPGSLTRPLCPKEEEARVRSKEKEAEGGGGGHGRHRREHPSGNNFEVTQPQVRGTAKKLETGRCLDPNLPGICDPTFQGIYTCGRTTQRCTITATTWVHQRNDTPLRPVDGCNKSRMQATEQRSIAKIHSAVSMAG